MKKNARANVLFTILILTAALALLAYTKRATLARLLGLSSSSDSGLYAHLQYNTDSTTGDYEQADLSLSENARYDYVSGPYTIHLEVKDGAIAFVDSPCPDHLCEQFGWLNEKDEYAVCMPAGAVVTIMAKG